MVKFLSHPDIQQQYLSSGVDDHNITTFPESLVDGAQPMTPQELIDEDISSIPVVPDQSSRERSTIIIRCT
jgi:hypothetical protein